MRYLFFPVSLFLTLFASAQKPLPDSTMNEFTRLTCECATLLKIDEVATDKAIEYLGTCINTNVGVYESKGWIKKEWQEDSVWSGNFNTELQANLIKTCPVFNKLLEKVNKPADVPNPLPSVDEKYFLAKEWMIQKSMQEDVHAGNENMKRWSAKTMTDAKIQMVFDIRYIFKDEQDAAAYFIAKLEDMREGGELTANTLKDFGASESRVYGANPRMMELFGDIDMAQYNFVFRLKNTVAKVFVSASKKATYEETVAFAKEAIGRIKAVK